MSVELASGVLALRSSKQAYRVGGTLTSGSGTVALTTGGRCV